MLRTVTESVVLHCRCNTKAEKISVCTAASISKSHALESLNLQTESFPESLTANLHTESVSVRMLRGGAKEHDDQDEKEGARGERLGEVGDIGCGWFVSLSCPTPCQCRNNMAISAWTLRAGRVWQPVTPVTPQPLLEVAHSLS